MIALQTAKCELFSNTVSLPETIFNALKPRLMIVICISHRKDLSKGSSKYYYSKYLLQNSLYIILNLLYCNRRC